MAKPPPTTVDQVVSLAKRRGFVYPTAEIYGGFRSSYDYGPLGSLMLRNVREAWIRANVQQRDDVVLIDAAILGPPAVFEASGHLANFTDPLVDCTKCKQRFREDHLDDPHTCPNCGAKESFTAMINVTSIAAEKISELLSEEGKANAEANWLERITRALEQVNP